MTAASKPSAWSDRNPLLSCIVVLLLGFCAGMQLGKIAPIVGYFSGVHAYSLTVIGWLTALIGLFVALAAIPTARLIDRVGTVGALKAGAIILTVGAALLALVDTLTLHLAARVIEAIGYVPLVIAAPAYLATRSRPSQRPVLLALWGSFVPVGYALANIQASFVIGALGEAASLATAALMLAIVTLATVWTVRDTAQTSHHEDRRNAQSPKQENRGALRSAILLATGFGIYVLLQMGFFTFLPAFIEIAPEPRTLSPAAIALFVPAGNLIAALLLVVLPARSSALLAVLAMALSVLAASFLFRTESPPVGIAYAAFSLLGGIMASCVFGSIPQAISGRLSAALVIGLIAQAGGIGTIGGPPLAGYLLDMFGWGALSWLLAVLSAVGAAVLLPLLMPTAAIRS